MRPRLTDFPTLVRQTAAAWWEDNVFRYAASLAYYTIFSLAPMLLLAIAVAGILFGEETAQRHLVVQVTSLVGADGARFVNDLVQGLRKSGSGPIAAAIGIGSVLFGSTVVFAELQSALNKIWDVSTEATSRGMVFDVVRKRLLSLFVVIGVGFLLLVSLVIDAVIAATQEWIVATTPMAPWIWPIAHQVVSLAITTALFMMIFKLLPDVQLSWRDVFAGALFTAVLFSIGKHLIGLYLGRMAVGNAYGAAGAFVVLLVWVYYSSLITFFGAEFTQVYAQHTGTGAQPEEHAVRVGEKPHPAQGEFFAPRMS